MMRLCLALLCALVVLSPDAGTAAAALVVNATVRGLAVEQPVSVEFVATRVDGTSKTSGTIFVPGRNVLDVPDGNWELSIHSSVFWAMPAVVSAGQEAAVLLWPTGIVRAGITTSRAGSRLNELRVSFSPPTESAVDSYPQGASTCSITDGQWQCVIPAGTCDLRILSTGYAAEFRWGQTIQRGQELYLGQIRLRPGASLLGFVTKARSVSAATQDIVVIARLRSASPDVRTREYRAAVSPRGFFQIAGLTAGDYIVHAEAKRFRSDDRPVTVLENRNAELRSALVLDRPRQLSLRVLSSAGATESNRWHLRLFRQFPDAGRMEEYRTAMTDEDGNWSADVVPGDYFLQVSRDGESIWHSADLEVSDSDVHRSIVISATKISGYVRLGDKPLPNARLTLGGAQGAEQVHFTTDRNGEFGGEIPAKELPTWEIAIESDEPPVRRSAEYAPNEEDDGSLRFDIDLPSTIVRGRVVNEEGATETNAVVTLRSTAARTFEQRSVGADGRFELHGFEPGSYRIQAEAFQASSEIMNIEASAKDAAEIEIVLRKAVLVRGRVQSRTAAGIGATLVGLQREVATEFVPSTTTDADGLFELMLPPKTRVFDLVVSAPGFALSSGRVDVQDDKMLTLTMDQTGGPLTLVMPRGETAVLRHDGAELPARWIAARSGAAIQERDGADAVTISNVEAGEYTLCSRSVCRGGVVGPGGSLELSLRDSP